MAIDVPNYTILVYICPRNRREMSAMKNVTITLDEKTAAWVRLQAARLGMSVSRFVGEILRDSMHQVRDYNEAMRGFLAMKPFEFRFIAGRRPTRDELHDRADLR